MSLTPPRRPPLPLHALYAARLYAHGRQLIFPLYEAVVNILEAKPGDLVLIRVHLPFVTFRIANPDLSMPVPRFNHEELPPTYRELLQILAENLK